MITHATSTYLGTVVLQSRNEISWSVVHIYRALTSITPGMQVRVVNSYDAAVDSVRVTVLSKVLFPTDGKPISAIRASPDFTTSKPSP